MTYNEPGVIQPQVTSVENGRPSMHSGPSDLACFLAHLSPQRSRGLHMGVDLSHWPVHPPP